MKKTAAVLFYALFVFTVFTWLTSMDQTVMSVYMTFFPPHWTEWDYIWEREWMERAGFLVSYLWAVFVIIMPILLTVRAFKKMDTAPRQAFLYLSGAFLFSAGVIWHYIHTFP